MNKEMDNNGILGVNVYWTCANDFRQEQDKVRSALASNGLDKDLFNWPSDRALVSRAVYSLQDRRHKDNRCIVEKAREDKSRVVYGVLNREDINGSEVAYEQNTTVELDKATGALNVSGQKAQRVTDAVASFKGIVTDYDLRVFLRRVVRFAHGIAKRPSGGIYFVPLAGVEKVEAAKRVVEAIAGEQAKLYVERVFDGSQERENVWDSVEEEVGKAIDDALDLCRRVGSRVSAAKGYAADIKELKKLVDEYERLLGAEAKTEVLRNKLANAEAEVAAKITALELEAAKIA